MVEPLIPTLGGQRQAASLASESTRCTRSVQTYQKSDAYTKVFLKIAEKEYEVREQGKGNCLGKGTM